MGSPQVWTLVFSCLVAVLCETTQAVTIEVPSIWTYLGDSVTVRCVGTDMEDMEKINLFIDDRTVTADAFHQIIRTNTKVELKISSVSSSDYGLYKCVSDDRVHAQETLWGVNRRRSIRLTTSSWTLPDQGSVTLKCSVVDFRKHQWIRRFSLHFEILHEETNIINVHRGGVYSCRGLDEMIITRESDTVDIQQTGLPLQMPPWACLRDTVTLRCVGPSNKPLYFYKDGVIVKTDTNHQFNRKSETTEELIILSVSESDRGSYSCGIDGETLYYGKELKKCKERSISLTSDQQFIPERGRVTLSCQIEYWIHKYEWFRRTSAQTSHFEILKEDTTTISVHRGGVYSCRGKEELILTPESDSVTVWETVSKRAAVKPEPDWTEVFVGESLSLRCEVEDEGNSETYEWKRAGVLLPTTTREYTLSSVSKSDSGDYFCRGTRGTYQKTQWSQKTRLQVIDKAVPVLSVSPSWLSPSASVSLKCDVTAPSAGWRFHWYRAVPGPSGLYSYELLSEGTSGTAHGSFSVHGLNSTTGFVCRAARGNPEVFTEYSLPGFVWSADAGSRAAPDVLPNRSQHFTRDTVSVNCSSDSSDEEWTVQMFSLTTLSLQQCPSHTTGHKHICDFSAAQETRAVFWCESGSGEMTDAVNITVHNSLILLIPALPVPEGHNVTLTCKQEHSAFFSSVRFYKDGQLVQEGPFREYTISAVSKSDQGSYKCELQVSAQKTVWTSPESWLSVRLSEKRSSLVLQLVLVVVFLIVLLLILLLLLWRCRNNKDLCFKGSQEANQTSAGDHVTSAPDEITYSKLELKNIRVQKNRKQEDDTVYSEVLTHSAAEDEGMYSQVNLHRKRKAKDKSKDECVYSEVKSAAVGHDDR